jgi:hypothetical protein
MGLEVLLSVLQGIVMLGLGRHGGLETETETAQSIREAVAEAWVVEVCHSRGNFCGY